MSHFYGTEFEIWAGFGPVGSTEKNIWGDYEQLLGVDFSCFYKQNFQHKRAALNEGKKIYFFLKK
jgi:hypothetical protein